MMLRWKLCVAVLALCVVSGTAHAQRGGRGGTTDPARLVQIDAVKKALGLSESQTKRIAEAAKKAREKRQKAEEKAREAYTSELEGAMSSILTSKQSDRLFGIQVQQMGTRAIYNEKVQKAIGLNRTQREKIANAQKMFREMFRFGGPRQSKEEREKNFKKFREIQEDMKNLLSVSQKKRLEALKGEEVNLPRFPGFGGGNRGNRGRRGPGAGGRPNSGRPPQAGRPSGDL